MRSAEEKMLIETIGFPYASSTQVHSRGARIEQTPTGVVRIEHSAIISSPIGSSTFTQLNWSLNPGVTPFPWIRDIAHKYEKYRFTELTFKYIPQVATTTAGTVGFTMDLDVTDSPVGGTDPLVDAMQAEYAATGVVWSELEFPQAHHRRERAYRTSFSKWRLVRDTILGRDVAPLYDAAIVSFFTQGTPASSLGQIMVTYVVELAHPHAIPEVVFAVRSAYHQLHAGTLTSTATTPIAMDVSSTPEYPGQLPNDAFGMLPMSMSAAGLGTQATGARLLPKGRWLVSYEAAIESTGATGVTDGAIYIYSGTYLALGTTLESHTAFRVGNTSAGVKDTIDSRCVVISDGTKIMEVRVFIQGGGTLNVSGHVLIDRL
jgi:hypothetical protein